MDDLGDKYNRFKKEGGSFNYPLRLLSDGCVKVVFCSAPEGTFIELVEKLT